MLHDFRHAIRALLRAPGFAAVVVATLALSIGATTTIYSVVRGVLLQPLPFADPDRLVTLWQRAPGVGVDEDWFSIAQYADIRDDTPALEHVAITWGQEVTLTADGTDPARVGALQVSSSFFDVMGVDPRLGRRLRPEDDAPGAAQKALLGHEIFVQRFGADPALVGSTIALDGQLVEIVGVMPPLVLDADVMPTLVTVPVFDLFLSFPLQVVPTTRGSENYNIIGKLDASATLAQLETELLAIADGFTQDSLALAAGLTAGEDFWVGVVPLIEEVTGEINAPLVLLLAATFVLLLIACANVANLLLTRATTKQRELSIRASLGAPRQRMIRLAMLGSLLLSGAGGAIGVMIAITAVAALHAVAPSDLPRLSEIGVDPGVLLFAAGLCILSSVVFGVGPAIRTATADPGEVLREGSAAARARSLWRNGASSALVVLQVALSMLLVVGAGLLVRTFWQLQTVDPGFDADRALSFRVALAGDRYGDPAARYDFYDQLFERTRGDHGWWGLAAAADARPRLDRLRR
ncbi:MAG: FtsX-like permease family protein [Acidobacteria bacterium]|nr:FtsX-like permease family protein [Acidobacteriota bacterium]